MSEQLNLNNLTSSNNDSNSSIQNSESQAEAIWRNLVTAFPESGTPTQENVDQSFKFFADIENYVNAITTELESFKNAAFKDRKEKIEKIKKYIEEKIMQKVLNKLDEEVSNNQIFEKIKERLEVIKPLIEAPTSLDEIIDYLASLAEYFAKPYEDMIKIIEFYSEYIPKMSEKITKTIELLQKALNDLQNELNEIINEAKEYKDGLILSISELAEEKFKKEISETLDLPAEKIDIKRTLFKI